MWAHLHHWAAHSRTEELLNMEGEGGATVDDGLDLAAKPCRYLGEDQAVEERCRLKPTACA